MASSPTTPIPVAQQTARLKPKRIHSLRELRALGDPYFSDTSASSSQRGTPQSGSSAEKMPELKKEPESVKSMAATSSELNGGKKNLKRKFSAVEADFAGEILKFCTRGKIYHIHGNVFHNAFPNFGNLYRKDGAGIYQIMDMAGFYFECLLYWALYGRLKIEFDCLNLADSTDELKLPYLPYILHQYHVAESIQASELQNALIDHIFDNYIATNKIVWEACYPATLNKSSGIGLLLLDLFAYAGDDKALKYLKSKEPWLEKSFFSKLSYAMMNRQATPPYLVDRTKYYV